MYLKEANTMTYQENNCFKTSKSSFLNCKDRRDFYMKMSNFETVPKIAKIKINILQKIPNQHKQGQV